RGYISDATPADQRGEAFGLYGAAQMGGLLLGPAIGGLGSAAFGGVAFIFWFGGISSFLAAITIAVRVHERPAVMGSSREAHPAAVDLTVFPHDADHLVARATRPASTDMDATAVDRGPASLVNRMLVAAILFTIGGNFAAGTYEVIWSVYLTRLGA